MKRISRLAGVAALATVVSVAANVHGIGSPSVGTSAQLEAQVGCKPVWFIGAAGSGEGGSGYDGMGPAVDHMAQTVKSDLTAKGLDMSFMPVDYPAASVNVLKPNATVTALLKENATAAAVAEWIHTSLDAYDASINNGIQQAEDDAEAAVSQCPNVKLIMGGYSQGATVIHDAEVWLAANKSSVFKHVVGTLLLADPDRVPHTRARSFGDPLSPTGDEGMRTWLCVGKYLCAVTPHDVPGPSTTANIVDSGDLVGDFKLTDLGNFSGPAAIHTHYATLASKKMVYEPELATAANWVASLIPGVSPPPRPAPGTGRILISPCLNLRSGPNGDTALIGCIPLNTSVAIDCTASGNAVTGPYGTETIWDRTTYDGTTGYVADADVYTGANGPVAPSCASTPTQAGPTGRIIISPCLNLRAGPNGSTALIGCIPDNTVITVLCTARGNPVTGPYGTETVWDRTNYNSITGYVADAEVYTGTNSATAPAC